MSLDPVALQALDLPALRAQLAAHQAARPVDIFSVGMADWIEAKAKLRFAIERKEGELTSPPFFITVPPKPMEGIRIQPELDFRRLTHRKPVEPIEAPMDPTPSHERLQRLLARLAKNDADQNDAAAYTTRADIRRFCEAEGLPVPPEARKRDPLAAKQAKAAERVRTRIPTPAPATAPPASASPAASVAHGAEPPRAQSAAHRPAPGADRSAAPTHPEGDPVKLASARQLIGAREPSGSAPSARLRALRSQALEILPELEDLSPEAAAQAQEELALLAKTLHLGGDLIARRIA